MLTPAPSAGILNLGNAQTARLSMQCSDISYPADSQRCQRATSAYWLANKRGQEMTGKDLVWGPWERRRQPAETGSACRQVDCRQVLVSLSGQGQAKVMVTTRGHLGQAAGSKSLCSLNAIIIKCFSINII